MIKLKKMHFLISLTTAIYLLLTVSSSIWAGQNSPTDLNLSPEQIKALETIVDEFNEKIFNVISEVERTKLELSLEFQREDRFVTKSKTTKSVKRANNLVKKLTDLYGDLLKLEAAYVLKTKDILTREQRKELIRRIDFDMEISAGWMQSHEIEEVTEELDLSEDQRQEILSLMTELKKKEAKIEQKIVALAHELEETLNKDTVNDKQVNKIILSLVDLGVDLLHLRVDHRLQAKDVLTVDQKKKLLHAIFIAPDL